MRARDRSGSEMLHETICFLSVSVVFSRKLVDQVFTERTATRSAAGMILSSVCLSVCLSVPQCPASETDKQKTL